jgi:PAS domain S-box-containing protein
MPNRRFGGLPDPGMRPIDRVMPSLRPLALRAARPLTDGVAAAALVLAWATDDPMIWLHVTFIAVAASAFFSRSPWAVAGRLLVVTLVGLPTVIDMWSHGRLMGSDLIEIPLVALMGMLFAVFVVIRARDEQRILADRAALERQIDAIPFAVAAFDSVAHAITWNTTAERLFGWSRHEIVGRPNPIVGPGEQQETLELQRRVLGGEHLDAVEVTRYTRDGRALDLSVYTAAIDEARPDQGFLVLYVDIRERKRTERERDDANLRYQHLIEALPLVTYIDLVDDQATNVYTSPQFEAVSGWPAADAIPFGDLLHPDDYERVMARVQHCNATREPFVDEYRLRHRDGSYFWVRDESTIIDDDHGTPYARGFLLDITERKRLEEQLLQSQKMDALGQLAGGIAHDFNNLLTGISGYADLAAGEAEPSSRLERCLQGIRTAAGEAASLTARLLAFSRRDVSARTSVDVNELVRVTADMLMRLVREDVSLELELADDLPCVSADPVQLKQVVLNLALNARDAMPQGGRLVLSTSAEHGRVVLHVRDTGTGMDDETRRRALEPFFTTKSAGEGTGLGLSVVYGVVQALGGSLTLESHPGVGTTVAVTLPPCDQAAAAVEPVFDDSPAAGSERVLVAEDRAVVRDLARDVLTAAGFAVEVASDGAEALEASHVAGFDLLVTDVVMPGMSGLELATTLRERLPALPVLYMSGYTDDVLDDAALAAPRTAFLRKPFGRGELERAVRELLDQSLAA